MMSFCINTIAILNISIFDYTFINFEVSKSEGLKMMENSVLEDKGSLCHKFIKIYRVNFFTIKLSDNNTY